jgi:integration host factor subunit beta
MNANTRPGAPNGPKSARPLPPAAGQLAAPAAPGAPGAPGAMTPGIPGTVTKKDLVNRIADRTGETKVVTKNIIQMFLDEIIRELSSGNRLEFRDFGVFEVKPRRARRAQNPRTLEKVSVPPKKVVKFKVGRVMRECVTTQTPASTADDD